MMMMMMITKQNLGKAEEQNPKQAVWNQKNSTFDPKITSPIPSTGIRRRPGCQTVYIATLGPKQPGQTSLADVCSRSAGEPTSLYHINSFSSNAKFNLFATASSVYF